MERISYDRERLLEAFRAGAWTECVRMVRPHVESQPSDFEARSMLAGFYQRMEQKHHALAHLEATLQLACERGDLFRAIAAQRGIDQLEPARRIPGRFAELRRGLEQAGRGADPPAGVAATMAETLRSLDPESFERAVQHLTVDRFEAEPRTLGAEGGSLWIVLHGRLRWRVARSAAVEAEPGRAAERIADTHRPLLVDPTLDEPLRLRIEADAPTECLHFESPLVRKALGDDAFARPGAPASGAAPAWDPYMSFNEAERALVARRPRRPLELDEMPRAPREPVAEAPPRLPTAALAPVVPAEPSEMKAIDLPPPTAPDQPAPESGEIARRETPASEDAGAHGISLVELFDAEVPADRRRSMRVAVACGSRIALLGVSGPAAQPHEGQLIDLSETGLGVRFPSADLRHGAAALQGAAIRLDLGLPGEAAPLRLAGRVRWIVADDDAMVRVGIEFILLTPDDHRAIVAAMKRAGAAPPATAGDQLGLFD